MLNLPAIKSFLRSLPIRLLFILLFANNPSLLFAEPEAGFIAAVSGTVTIKRSGQHDAISAFRNAGIKTGDALVTGKDGKAQIALTDESFINIGPDSVVRINQYSFAEHENRRRAVIKVASGRARFVIFKVISVDSAFRVETDYATILVKDRGDFIVTSLPDVTEVIALDKTLLVRNASNIIIGEVRLSANQKTAVRKKTPPAPPSVITPHERRLYLNSMKNI